MDPQAVDSFKSEIRNYVSTCNELEALSKQASALRKQKAAMESKVMQSMRTFEVDVCQVQDGKVMIKTAKRCGGIKPKVAEQKITEFFGGEEAERAQALVRILEESREMSEKTVIRYHHKRRRIAEATDEDTLSVAE